MIFIINPCSDSYFNVSCEEFMLKNFTEECFMLWINSPSIIVGKHQNTLAEINHDFVNKYNIPVIRRISGGGTVFHDSGNVNFTFITNSSHGKAINFPLFLHPVIEVLHKLGIPAVINPRNNIVINNKKISGTAAHFSKNKVIHHGTLLFNSSISDINRAIKVDSQKYSDKSIKSVRSPVTNIYDYLTEKIEIGEFMKLLEKKIKQAFAIKTNYSFKEEDIKKIEQLSEIKYRTWEWNYGYSPNYRFYNSVLFEEIKVDIEFHVKKGIIEFISLSNDILTANKSKIENALLHQPHEKVHIKKAFAQFYFPKIMEEKLIRSFF